MSFFDFLKGRSKSGPIKQLDNKIAILLDHLNKQVVNPEDQAPTKARRIYEDIVDSQHLTAPQEYYVICLTLTAIEGPGQQSALNLAQVFNRLYIHRMRHEEMTGDRIGFETERLASKLLLAYRQAQSHGLSMNEIRRFLYARVERFKILTELEESLAILRKLGAQDLATEIRSLVKRMTAPLK